MAYNENLKTVTLNAQADHTGDIFKFVVRHGTEGRGFALAGAGARALGVLQNKPAGAGIKPAAGNTNSGFSDGVGGTIALVEAGGVSKVVTGAPITEGQSVAVDANGRAVSAATGNAIVGIAQEAASASGQVISVLLTDGGTA